VGLKEPVGRHIFDNDCLTSRQYGTTRAAAVGSDRLEMVQEVPVEPFLGGNAQHAPLVVEELDITHVRVKEINRTFQELLE
jgi:hypothetical protein